MPHPAEAPEQRSRPRSESNAASASEPVSSASEVQQPRASPWLEAAALRGAVQRTATVRKLVFTLRLLWAPMSETSKPMPEPWWVTALLAPEGSATVELTST